MDYAEERQLATVTVCRPEQPPREHESTRQQLPHTSTCAHRSPHLLSVAAPPPSSSSIVPVRLVSFASSSSRRRTPPASGLRRGGSRRPYNKCFVSQSKTTVAVVEQVVAVPLLFHKNGSRFRRSLSRTVCQSSFAAVFSQEVVLLGSFHPPRPPPPTLPQQSHHHRLRLRLPPPPS